MLKTIMSTFCAVTLAFSLAGCSQGESQVVIVNDAPPLAMAKGVSTETFEGFKEYSTSFYHPNVTVTLKLNLNSFFETEPLYAEGKNPFQVSQTNVNGKPSYVFSAPFSWNVTNKQLISFNALIAQPFIEKQNLSHEDIKQGIESIKTALGIYAADALLEQRHVIDRFVELKKKIDYTDSNPADLSDTDIVDLNIYANSAAYIPYIDSYLNTNVPSFKIRKDFPSRNIFYMRKNLNGFPYTEPHNRDFHVKANGLEVYIGFAGKKGIAENGSNPALLNIHELAGYPFFEFNLGGYIHDESIAKIETRMKGILKIAQEPDPLPKVEKAFRALANEIIQDNPKYFSSIIEDKKNQKTYLK